MCRLESRLCHIISVKQSHALHGASGAYARTMAKAILALHPQQGSFRSCLNQLVHVRAEIIRLDARSSSRQRRWYLNQLNWLRNESLKRLKGRSSVAIFTLAKPEGVYSPLYRRLRGSKSLIAKPALLKGLELSRSPLYSKRSRGGVLLLHSPSRDIPTLMEHLDGLWNQTLGPSNRKVKLQTIAQFEWVFFTANPLGRCAASIGDALSLALQIKCGLPLRNTFMHMDWEALSRTLNSYILWRSKR